MRTDSLSMSCGLGASLKSGVCDVVSSDSVEFFLLLDIRRRAFPCSMYSMVFGARELRNFEQISVKNWLRKKS